MISGTPVKLEAPSETPEPPRVPTLTLRTLGVKGHPCVVTGRVCGYARDAERSEWFFLATENACYLFRDRSVKVRGVAQAALADQQSGGAEDAGTQAATTMQAYAAFPRSDAELSIVVVGASVVAVDIPSSLSMWLDLTNPDGDWMLLPSTRTPGVGGRIFAAGGTLLAQERHDAGAGSTLALFDFRPSPHGLMDNRLHPLCLQLVKMLTYVSVRASVLGLQRQDSHDAVKLLVVFQCDHGEVEGGQAVLGEAALEFDRRRSDVVLCGLPLMFDDENMTARATNRLVLRRGVQAVEMWNVGAGGLWFNGGDWGAFLDARPDANFMRFNSRGFVHQAGSMPLLLRSGECGIPNALYELNGVSTKLRLLARLVSDGKTTCGDLELAFVAGRRLFALVSSDQDGGARLVATDV